MAVYAAGYFLSGIFVMDLWAALFAGAALMIINAIVRPVIKLLTLPLNIITFGIFGIILNGLFFLFVSQLINGFTVVGFLPALWGSIVVSLLSGLAFKFVD